MTGYVVRRVTPRMVMQALFAVAALAIWSAVVHLPRWMLAMAAFEVIVSTAQLVRTVGTRLRLDSEGITLGASHRAELAVHLPWTSVREVVVVGDPTAEPRVGVRLHQGAPLPPGVRGLVHDPAQPDRVQPSLVREVPGLDRTALELAVQAHGLRVVSATAI